MNLPCMHTTKPYETSDLKSFRHRRNIHH
jgi:hypothetical protein